MHPDTALRLSLHRHTCVTDCVYTYTQQFLWVFGEFVGIPFINLTRRSIALLRATALPDCQIARSLGQSLSPGVNPGRPCAPGVFGSPSPSDAKRINSHRGPCWGSWPAARSRHTSSPFRGPGGPPPHSRAPPADLESTASREWQLTQHHWR